MYSARAVCKCVDIGWKRGVGGTWRSPTRRPLSAWELLLHSLSLRLLVQAQLLQHPRHRAVRAQAGPGFCLMSVLPYPGGGVGGWVWQNFRVGGCPTTPPPPRVGWDFVGALGLLSQCHFFLSSVAGSV